MKEWHLPPGIATGGPIALTLPEPPLRETDGRHEHGGDQEDQNAAHRTERRPHARVMRRAPPPCAGSASGSCVNPVPRGRRPGTSAQS
jgi:hypothetical protein